MHIKKIKCPTGSYLEKVSGTQEWYYAASFTGDLYEAEEIVELGHTFEGTELVLIHYPSGKTFEPFPRQEKVYIERPVWDGGKIALLRVDFNINEIAIIHVDMGAETHEVTARLPLNSVKDCYNLKLTQQPLTLYRQGSEGLFEIYWPERISFERSPRECFYFREGDKLYFSEWHEDPDYREMVRVRACSDGTLLEEYSGMLFDMPDGSKWLL